MRVSLFYFLFLVIVVSSRAQSISGIVVNNDGHIIPGTEVVEIGTNNQVTSNKSGEFELNTTSNSKVTLQISFTGYEEQQVVVHPNEFVEIVLENTNPSIKPQKTTTQREKKKKLKLKEKTVLVSDIKFQGLALNTFIEQPTGFSIRQTGDIGTRASYSITGLPEKQIRFFIDGIPMEYFGSDYSLSALPASVLGQVAIYNKWTPLHLMNDTGGIGAINFSTKKEIDDTLEFNYSIGSFNTHQISTSGYSRDFSTGMTFKGVAFFNYSDNNYKLWRDDLNNSLPGIREEERSISAEHFNDGFQNIGAKIDLGVSGKSWADQLFLSVLYANKYKEVQHGASMKVPFGERHYRQETIMPALTYNKKDLFLDGLHVNLFTAFDTKHRDVFDVSRYEFDWYGEKVEDDIIGEQSDALSFTDDKTILSRFVLNYDFNEANTITLVNNYSDFSRKGNNIKATVEEQTIGDKYEMTKNVLGLSFQNTSLDNRYETTVFGKYFGYKVHVLNTNYDPDLEEYTPSNSYKNNNPNYGYGVNFKYNLNSDWHLQTTIDKKVALPSPDQLFGNESESILSTFGVEGIEELEPEDSYNFNLGVGFHNLNFYDHQFNAEANVFYRSVKNYIQASVINLNENDYFYYESHEKIVSKGADLFIDYKYRNIIDFSISTSYLNARNKDESEEVETGENYYNNRLKNQPYFKANAGVKYRFFYDVFKQKTQFELSWTTRYVHKYDRYWENSIVEDQKNIPSQLVNDFGVNYVFPGQKAFMSLDIRNVFDEHIYNAYALQEQGRAVFLKFEFKL